MFNIDPDMLSMIEAYNKNRKLKSGSKSMATMLKEPKKRKRKDAEKQWALISEMEVRAQISEETEKRKNAAAKRKFKK